MRLNSFYIPAEDWPGDAPCALTGGEARHMLKVLRTPVGAEVRLFDGRGNAGLFRLAATGRDRAELDPVELDAPAPRPDGPTLALGWSKSARRGWLLEKAVELGARGVAFWQASNSQGSMPEAPKPGWTDKLVAAAKQCEAAWLPELSCIAGGARGLAAVAEDHERCYLLEERSDAKLLTPGAMAGEVLAVIGPEGGLGGSEAASLRENGFLAANLGPRILRWETAALACLSLALVGNASDAED